MKPMFTSNQFVLVAGGSALGAVVRWLATGSFLNFSDRWIVVALNIVGSLLLGAVLGWATVRRSEHPDQDRYAYTDRVVAGVGTGFCGGLTSFSTFAVDIAGLLRSDMYLTALVTSSLTVVGATVVAAVGFFLAKSSV